MKKYIKITLSLILGTILIPSFVFAKTDVTLTSPISNTVVGNSFSVIVSISPKEETAYTSKIALSYSNDIIEATSFSFAPNLLPLSQPGYDLMDTTTGTIIKTGGMTNGVLSGTNKVFGTITFIAKKAGNAQISVSNNTKIYDNQNINIFSGSQNQLNITVLPFRPTEEVINTPESTTTAITATTTIDTGTTTNSQTASLGLFNTLTSSYKLISLLILIMIVAIVYMVLRKKEQNN